MSEEDPEQEEHIEDDDSGESEALLEEEDSRFAHLTTTMKHLLNAVKQALNSTMKNKNISAWPLEVLRTFEVPVKHSFDFNDPTPIYRRVRRQLPKYKDVWRKEIDDMLRIGIIIPSAFAWYCQVVIALKKDCKPRFYVDCWALSAELEADHCPPPKIEDIFDALRKSTIFKTLYLFLGYWQVKMAERCQEKTTFLCRYIPFNLHSCQLGF